MKKRRCSSDLTKPTPCPADAGIIQHVLICFMMYVFFVLGGSVGVIAQEKSNSSNEILDHEFAIQFGNEDSAEGIDVAVDGAGNIYALGFFEGTLTYETDTGLEEIVSHEHEKQMVTKIDRSGNILWVNNLNVSGEEITVDSVGNVYLTGSFRGEVDFDPSPDTQHLKGSSTSDIFNAFLLKLDTDGNFVWVKTIEGEGAQEASSIAVDMLDNIYVSGTFNGKTDFDPSEKVSYSIGQSEQTGYLLKLDSDGQYLWVHTFGGRAEMQPRQLAVSNNNFAYITGYFEGKAVFGSAEEEHTLKQVGNNGNVFISKVDQSGNFIWAKRFEKECDLQSERAHNQLRVYGIAVDTDDNIFVTGIFEGTADFDPGVGTADLVSKDRRDIFIAKLDSFGDYQWAHGFGGPDTQSAFDICIDSEDSVYITGRFKNTIEFKSGTKVVKLESLEDYDGLISKHDASGNHIWSRSIQGSGRTSLYSITVDTNKNIYVTGSFDNFIDLDSSTGLINLISLGQNDMFITKLKQNQEK